MAEPKAPYSAKKLIIAWSISVAGLMAALILTGVFNSPDRVELFRNLCDSFFIVGSAYLCAALLSSASKHGSFDFFTYNGQLFRTVILPSMREHKRVSYYDYISKKDEKRRYWRFGYLYVIALSHLAVSMVFLLLYYRFI